MYRYETHLHTAPVSRCATASVEENLRFYRDRGFAGVFITNHFLDGNINISAPMSYAEKLEFYFSDYEAGVSLGRKLGIDVFCGVEMSYGGTDFLVYGLDHAWYLAHPEIMEMDKRTELRYLMEQGAYIVQAHPFRSAWYIDHIRLYPDCVHGIEVVNACRTELENRMAAIYAKEYGFSALAGSDNHRAGEQKKLAGIETDSPILDEADFIRRIRDGAYRIFEEEIVPGDPMCGTSVSR